MICAILPLYSCEMVDEALMNEERCRLQCDATQTYLERLCPSREDQDVYKIASIILV